MDEDQISTEHTWSNGNAVCYCCKTNFMNKKYTTEVAVMCSRFVSKNDCRIFFVRTFHFL